MKFKNRIMLILMIFMVTTARSQFMLENAFPFLSFNSAVFLTHSYDGTNRIFVVEQSGIIKVFDNSPSATSVKTFLNITDRVSSGGEMGLLGLAFHPDYENNGYFYVNYTASSPRRTIISRFSVSQTNPDSADKNSEAEILDFSQPFPNHNGGWIGFGTDDGYLYIATGDGGSGGDPQNNGQKITNLLGKILRIDIDNGLPYSIPPGNPFVDSTGAVRKEIYAWGIRNPWRCSFDPVTHWLWVGDVGQNAWEEVDVVENGKNYGWRCYEGNHPFNLSGCNHPEYTFPVWEYPNSGSECSVTGGYVYRGPNLPELFGKYIYGDYCSRKIWSLEYDGINPTVNELLVTSASSITSFGVDQNNELYILSFSNVYRFTPTAAIIAPSNLNGFAAITLGVPPIIYVSLSWDDNSNNEDGFIIERKIENSSFEVIDSVGSNITSYEDWDLSDSTTYTYRVAAYNLGSNSGYSNEFEITTPTRLAAPTNLEATATSPTTVELIWEDNEFQEDGYKIERKLEGGLYQLIDSVSTNITFYEDTGLQDGMTYWYRVYTYLDGVASLYSNEDSANTPLIVSVDDLFNPEEYILEQNYPNPFNPSTVIRYNLPEESNIRLTVYNSLGKEVDLLADGFSPAGYYKKTWNANGNSSGVYYLKIYAESLVSDKSFSSVIKMLFLK